MKRTPSWASACSMKSRTAVARPGWPLQRACSPTVIRRERPGHDVTLALAGHRDRARAVPVVGGGGPGVVEVPGRRDERRVPVLLRRAGAARHGDVGAVDPAAKAPDRLPTAVLNVRLGA